MNSNENQAPQGSILIDQQQLERLRIRLPLLKDLHKECMKKFERARTEFHEERSEYFTMMYNGGWKTVWLPRSHPQHPCTRLKDAKRDYKIAMTRLLVIEEEIRQHKELCDVLIHKLFGEHFSWIYNQPSHHDGNHFLNGEEVQVEIPDDGEDDESEDDDNHCTEHRGAF